VNDRRIVLGILIRNGIGIRMLRRILCRFGLCGLKDTLETMMFTLLRSQIPMSSLLEFLKVQVLIGK